MNPHAKFASLFLASAIVSCLIIGCDSFSGPTEANASSAPKQPVPVEFQNPENQDFSAEVPVEDEAAAKSYRQRFNDWMGAATQSGQSASSAAGQWVGDSWNRVAESGAASAGNAATWANQTFQSMRDAGLTQANSAREWLLEEYNRPNSWEYKVLTVDQANSTPEELASQLNELGKERWDCFAVTQFEGTQTLLFKRHPKSYMPNLPLTDTLKLLNLMGHDEK